MDDLPGQLRVGAWKLIQQLARVEQLLFLRFGDPSVPAPPVLRHDSQASTMKRSRGEQLASDRPVADVTQPGQVPVCCRNRSTRAACFEVLNRFRAFECCRRQLTEFSRQNPQLTQSSV